MIRATISQTKNSLSEYLDKVRAGETILILDRNLPVARIIPLEGEYGDDLSRLEREGRLRRATGEFAPIPAPIVTRKSALSALIQERNESR